MSEEAEHTAASDEPEGRPITLENWSEFVLDELSADVEEKIWNRYVVMKQAEINTMMRALPTVARMKPRIDSLCSAVDGGCDPLQD